jgi:hypothetical protein
LLDKNSATSLLQSQTLKMQTFSNYLFEKGLLFLFHMSLFINSSLVTMLMRLVIQENSIFCYLHWELRSCMYYFSWVDWTTHLTIIGILQEDKKVCVRQKMNWLMPKSKYNLLFPDTKNILNIEFFQYFSSCHKAMKYVWNCRIVYI